MRRLFDADHVTIYSFTGVIGNPGFGRNTLVNQKMMSLLQAEANREATVRKPM